MPKISNAPSRMRSSVSVAHDTAASTTNKRIAVEKRITIKPGGQGRIRTSVARKERQIYSLLPLTTRPPVRPRRTASDLRHRPLTHLSGKTGGPSARNAHTSASRSYRAGSCVEFVLLKGYARRLLVRSWSWRRDLNPRPSDYKSDALPAELRQQAGAPHAGATQNRSRLTGQDSKFSTYGTTRATT